MLMKGSDLFKQAYAKYKLTIRERLQRRSSRRRQCKETQPKLQQCVATYGYRQYESSLTTVQVDFGYF